jgi:hypothetical protein
MSNSKISLELAEIAGIHAGDGYLRYRGWSNELDISGGFEEQEYYDEHVIPLFNKVFDLSVNGKFFVPRNTYGFRIHHKKVIQSMMKLGFPSGKKTLIVSIPNQIINCKNKKIWCAFLRGYFDTDGCLNFDRKITNPSPFQRKYHYYPRILFTSCSKNLALEVQKLIQKLGFSCRCYLYKPKKETENLKYKLQVTGNKALARWMKLVGTKNPSKISRYLIWKKFGFCPPNTNYPQRVNILKGKINPESFY